MADISKVQALKDYIKENYEAGTFAAEDRMDEVNTAVFRSGFMVEEDRIPVGIIADETVYLILRAEIADSTRKVKDRGELLEYLNKQNGAYKIFKHFIDGEGNVYVDVCLVETPDKFDPALVGAILDLLLQHLQEHYPTLRNFFEK